MLFRSFLRLGTRTLVDARELERLVLVVGDKPVPVVVNDGRERECVFLSPDVHYVQYMKFELDKIRNDLSARALTVAVDALGRIARPLGFNRCVSVNNWLFTTNPSLTLSAPELGELTEALVRRFPAYALVLRNVDAREESARHLYRDAGWKLVINRPVHEWSHAGLNRSSRLHVRADAKLLADPRFTVDSRASLAPGDEHRIAELYRVLYLEKHSRYNPRFTSRFFRAVHDAGMWRFTTVALDGRIVAFCTTFDDGPRIVTALVGYDTKLDGHAYPLYRMVVAEAMRHAQERGRLLFLSTGSAKFKHYRGSREWIEHEAVYDAHLPPLGRVPWTLFRTALDLGVKGLDTGQI